MLHFRPPPRVELADRSVRETHGRLGGYWNTGYLFQTVTTSRGGGLAEAASDDRVSALSSARSDMVHLSRVSSSCRPGRSTAADTAPRSPEAILAIGLGQPPRQRHRPLPDLRADTQRASSLLSRAHTIHVWRNGGISGQIKWTEERGPVTAVGRRRCVPAPGATTTWSIASDRRP